jgi:phosphatidylserine/phosphatidylglycerophosphate/cardiolipin synthase-like enzyme
MLKLKKIGCEDHSRSPGLGNTFRVFALRSNNRDRGSALLGLFTDVNILSRSRKLLLSVTVFVALVWADNVRVYAESLRVLHGEVEAFTKRLELIESAKSSVDIDYYEISDDETSGQLLAALLRAVDRSISIRIMADGHVGSNVMPKALMQNLIEHGISVRERPADVRYKLELGRQRMHDKLFIVDRMHLVTGGRNLEQEYFGIGCRKYIDCDVYTDGNAACMAAAYFEQRWCDPKTRQPDLHREEVSRVANRQKHPEWNCMPRCEAMEQVKSWLSEVSSSPIAAADLRCGSLGFDTLEVASCNIRFLHDFVGNAKNANGAIAPELLRLLQQARSSIDIETPYFVVSHELKSILLNVAHRGVRVRVLTNSLESTDQIAAHAGFANQRRWMLRAGIELHEMQGRNILHAKSLVVDGCIAMVGSYNFDLLSERRNSEVALVVTDSAFASQVSHSIAIHRSQSKPLQRGEIFRMEANESNASRDDLNQLRRLRIVAPAIKRYL